MSPLIVATRTCLRWLVSLVLLAIVTSASSVWAQSSSSATRLQSLVNDAAAQLRLSFRQDPNELQIRREELGRAIAAWNKSARGDVDNEKLADWLRQAMRVSMPGSREPLPPLPEFLRPAPAVEKVPDVLPSATTTTNTIESSVQSNAPEVTSTTTQHEPVVRESIIKSITDAPDTAPESTPAPSNRGDAKITGERSTSSSRPFFVVSPAPAGQPAAALPKNDAETDPFRDDPLPVGK